MPAKAKVKSKLTRLTKVLIFDEAIFQAIKLFFDAFLVSYFYQISPTSIFDLALYSFTSYFANIFLIFLLRNFIKRFNKVWLYRLGILMQLAFTLFVMVMGADIVNHVILLGILYGIRGIFNGYLTNMFIATLIPHRERISFYGISAVILGIVNLVFPLIFGATITASSFQTAAILVVALSGIRLINSFFVKNTPPERNKFNLAAFRQVLHRDKRLQKLFIIEFLKGVNLYGVMGLLANLLIVMHSGNDLELGGWISVFYICNIVAMAIFAKKYQRKYKTPVMLALLLLIMLGTFSILIEVNLVTAICYNLALYVGVRLVEYITNTDIHDRADTKRYNPRFITEFYSVREVAICLGRILGYGALMFVAAGLHNDPIAINCLFGFVALSMVATIILSLTLRDRG